MAETPKTHGPPIVSSSVKVKAGGQPTIPELQAVLGGMEALDRTTNNAWKTEQGGSWPRSPSRRARLSSAGFTVDAEAEETAQFRAAIQAMAARNVTRTEQATSRRLYGELFNNGNDAVAVLLTHRTLSAPITCSPSGQQHARGTA